MVSLHLSQRSALVSGATGPPADAKRVAEHTVRALLRTVPAAVPGVMFLSGGQARAPEVGCAFRALRGGAQHSELKGMYMHRCLWLCRAP